MFRDKTFLISISLFIGLQIFLYLFLSFFYTAVPFEKSLYFNSSHHYVQDPRATDSQFSLLNALGAWDGQWYLRIADAGYPSKAVCDAHPDPRFMGALSYAFFPFYPLILAVFDLLFQNIELTAFIIGNVILLANFVSLYFVVTKLFTKAIAIRTIFLLFLFPFSIFYRAYFTEGIFLLLLIWFGYFLIKHKWFYSSVIAALLFVTRPNGLFMGLILLVTLYKAIRHHKFSWLKAILYLALSLVPIALWCYVCYVLTGNALYWHKVQSIWFSSPSMLNTFTQNLEHLFGFFDYPIHGAKDSRIDVLTVVGTFILLMFSKKYFKKYPQLWWISFMIWLAPLLVKDLMSYTRYQIISYPIFIFLASRVRGWKFYLLSAIFLSLLLFTSLYFVNWQWVG